MFSHGVLWLSYKVCPGCLFYMVPYVVGAYVAIYGSSVWCHILHIGVVCIPGIGGSTQAGTRAGV